MALLDVKPQRFRTELGLQPAALSTLRHTESVPPRVPSVGLPNCFWASLGYSRGAWRTYNSTIRALEQYRHSPTVSGHLGLQQGGVAYAQQHR